jgi:hypothetical protein
VNEFLGKFTALNWKHYSPDLGNLTFISWEIQTGKSAAETVPPGCAREDSPKCRHDHRLKQDTRWKVDQLPDGTLQWTTPSGCQYTTEPTRYPI